MKKLRIGLILLLVAALAILGYCIYMLVKLHKYCSEIEVENENRLTDEPTNNATQTEQTTASESREESKEASQN